jgi:hypothetical protein
LALAYFSYLDVLDAIPMNYTLLENLTGPDHDLFVKQARASTPTQRWQSITCGNDKELAVKKGLFKIGNCQNNFK